MHLSLSTRLNHLIRLAIVTVLSLGIGAPVQANPLIIINNTKAALTIASLVSTTSQCVRIVYDKNGNRITQTVLPINSAPTIWGTATYGCFVWKQ